MMEENLVHLLLFDLGLVEVQFEGVDELVEIGVVVSRGGLNDLKIIDLFL
jgi:hypothetical protein